MAPIKDLGGGLALVSFIAQPKPRIPFLGHSLLRNQAETLAKQASAEICVSPLYFLTFRVIPR